MGPQRLSHDVISIIRLAPGLKWFSAGLMHGRLDAPRVPYSTLCHLHPALAICRMTSKEGRQEQMALWFVRAKVTPIVRCWVRKARRGPGREQKETKAGSWRSSGLLSPLHPDRTVSRPIPRSQHVFVMVCKTPTSLTLKDHFRWWAPTQAQSRFVQSLK